MENNKKNYLTIEKVATLVTLAISIVAIIYQAAIMKRDVDILSKNNSTYINKFNSFKKINTVLGEKVVQLNSKIDFYDSEIYQIKKDIKDIEMTAINSAIDTRDRLIDIYKEIKQ